MTKTMRINCWRPKRSFVHDSSWHPPSTTTTRTTTRTSRFRPTPQNRTTIKSHRLGTKHLSCCRHFPRKRRRRRRLHCNSITTVRILTLPTIKPLPPIQFLPEKQPQQQQWPLEHGVLDRINGSWSLSLSSHGRDECSTTATERGSLAVPTSSQSPRRRRRRRRRRKGPQEEQQESERPPQQQQYDCDTASTSASLTLSSSPHDGDPSCGSSVTDSGRWGMAPLYWDAPKVLDSNCDNNKKNSCSSGNQTKQVHSTRRMIRMAFPTSHGERQGCGLPCVTMTHVGMLQPMNRAAAVPFHPIRPFPTPPRTRHLIVDERHDGAMSMPPPHSTTTTRRLRSKHPGPVEEPLADNNESMAESPTTRRKLAKRVEYQRQQHPTQQSTPSLGRTTTTPNATQTQQSKADNKR